MLLVLDTETTGLTLHPIAPLDSQPHIVEFGWATIDGKGREVGRGSLLINPGMPIPPDSTRIHRIVDDDVKKSPLFRAAWPKIRAILEPIDLIIAHNAPFDYTMLELELRRIEETFAFPRMIDTIGLYRDHFGRDMKLTELFEKVTGGKLNQVHRALEDVDALVKIVLKDKLWKL